MNTSSNLKLWENYLNSVSLTDDMYEDIINNDNFGCELFLKNIIIEEWLESRTRHEDIGRSVITLTQDLCRFDIMEKFYSDSFNLNIIEKEDTCCICLDKKEEFLKMVCCGYSGACSDCMSDDNIEKCPICRSKSFVIQL